MPDPSWCRRRDLLRYGLIGLGGPAASVLMGRAASGRDDAPTAGRARSCILLYMDGAPSHIDLWDMKPDATAGVRGPFRPVATTVPGLHVCEHLPRMASRMHQVALIRSVSHDESVHPPALYHVLTGFKEPNTSGNPRKRPVHHPHFGAVVGKLAPATSSAPGMVELPETMALDGPPMAGQDAGYLGPAFDPFRVRVALESPEITKPDIGLPAGVSRDRLGRRLGLLERSEGRRDGGPSSLAPFQRQALSLIDSGALDRAFDLDREPPAVRDRYGRHRHGRCVLLARRLVEAGVRFVAVNWGREPQDWADGVKGRVANNPWDTHRNHFPLLKDSLVPRADQALSALLDDLEGRGLLSETLVLWMGEFGRTPRISSFASRDHWPAANSVIMAGGGVPGGLVLGRTDATAAEVTDRPVSPPDILATVYRSLGIDPGAVVRDQSGRAHPLTTGRPIPELLGA